MTVEDGHRDNDCDEWMLEKDDHNKDKMRKIIIRLMLNVDTDLKIMPIYFQRLRMHAKVRKLWKYHLNSCNVRCDKNESGNSMALKLKGFKRWFAYAQEIKQSLPHKPFNNLQKQEFENKAKL